MSDFQIHRNSVYGTQMLGMDSLVKKAVEAAKDGELSQEELAQLKHIAENDDNHSTLGEKAFIQSLENSPEAFVKAAAQFDANTFSWEFAVAKTQQIKTESGNQVDLRLRPTRIREAVDGFKVPVGQALALYQQDPKNFQISDAVDLGLKTEQIDLLQNRIGLLKQLSPEAQKTWQNLDVFDVKAVKNFIDAQNFSFKERAAFVESYLQSHYLHAGEGVSWNNTPLQEGINAMPTTSDGCKFFDCEGFAALGMSLLSTEKSSAQPYSLVMNSGGRHQVAMVREGDQGVLINNGNLSFEPNLGNQTDNAYIEAHLPVSRVRADQSGAMVKGFDSTEAGDQLSPEFTVTKKIDLFNIQGRVDNQQGQFHVRISLDAQGNEQQLPDLQSGDRLNIDGNTITVTEDMQGYIDLPNGKRRNVTLTLQQGQFRFDFNGRPYRP